MTLTDAEELREKLAAIENQIDRGRYVPGPWAKLIKEIATRPQLERRYLSHDVSRVSRKLHLRGGRRLTITLWFGIGGEVLLTLAGSYLLSVALEQKSN